MEEQIIKFLRQKDFVMVKKIGRGGTGTTVLLKDELIDKLFVCKKYLPAMGIDPKTYYSNFITEIKLMHEINHPNIVRVYNYYLYPEMYTGYILMEYIEGEQISVFVSKNPEKVNSIFEQVISGFMYLEDSRILHRDIRDSNILVTTEGIVEIIDFGFGKKVEFESDKNKSISLNWWCETPNEFTDKKYDERTEIYFIGKLFEQLIRDNALSGFVYIDLLRKMIDKDPEKRIEWPIQV